MSLMLWFTALNSKVDSLSLPSNTENQAAILKKPLTVICCD